MISSFRAETLIETNKTPDGRVEMTLKDRDGNEHVLSLPQMIAVDLVEVFQHVERDLEIAGVRQYKHVTSWSVGRADHLAAVLVRLNSAPFRVMEAVDALNLARLLQEAGQTVLAESDGKVQ